MPPPPGPRGAILARLPPVPTGAPLRRLARDLVDLLVPPLCAGCRCAVPRDSVLCRACDRALARVGAWACALCQERAAYAPGGRCRACEAEAEAGALAACCAAVWFEDAGAQWVKRFKYAAPGLRGLDAAAEAVVRLLVREAAARVPGGAPDALVPVPLHPARIRARGFQPAALLARCAGAALGAPVLGAALARTRDTPSQTGKGRAARRANVAGCFAAAARAGAPLRHVWLVDDVVTTGATLREAARVLRGAGVRRISALCVARTPAPPV